MPQIGLSRSLVRASSSADDPESWQVVLVDRNLGKVVRYHERQNTLQVSSTIPNMIELDQDGDEELEVISNHATPPRRVSPPHSSICPFCGQSTPRNPNPFPPAFDARYPAKNGRYFNLLATANSAANSAANSPNITPTTNSSRNRAGNEAEPTLNSSTLNAGYFDAFFQEIQLLGKGGAGTVHLVRHILNGEALGLYACKKVAVGNSAPSLLRILREVHLLEVVQHPNIINYHHAWVESSRMSAFAPSVPTLFILMAYANGSSLDNFIRQRAGIPSPNEPEDVSKLSSQLRKELHRQRKLGAVHLLRLDEILGLFEQIVSGLSFLHDRAILHLDLKPENVLLHWQENSTDLLPTIKLSDFGNATSNLWSRERLGGSGTLAFTPPESFYLDEKTGKFHEPDRSTDLWALGLILHNLAFFTLPYQNQNDCAALEQEIKHYAGFFPSDANSLDHGIRHDVPLDLLRLIARLVHRQPGERISCDKVFIALQALKQETEPEMGSAAEANALVPAISSIRPTENSDLGANLPLISETALLKAATSSVPNLHVTQTSEAWSLLQRQLIAAVMGLAKLISLEGACHNSSVARWVIYFTLIVTIADVIVANVWLTAFLAIFHFALINGAKSEIVCNF